MARIESERTLKSNVKKLQKKLGVNFRVDYTLMTALTRRSYKNEHKDVEREDNERLEFLGDSVLKLLISEHLYHKSKDPEGEMTILRSKIEKNDTLASIAKKIGLKEHILMTEGERKIAGDGEKKILADTLEAIIGAIYIDQGLEKTREFLKETMFWNLIQILI
jgi:ribonuclease-3